MHRPTARIGHNRQRQPGTLPRSHPAVQRQVAALLRLRAAAIGEANRHIGAYTRVAPWSFAPSRLAKWPTGRGILQDVFDAVWPKAIAKRLGQMRHYERKLARCCQGWPGFTEAQLSEPPISAFTLGKLVIDSWPLGRLLADGAVWPPQQGTPLMSELKLGTMIKVIEKGTLNGVPKEIEFVAIITHLDDRRAEYRGGGHRGGFALSSPMLGRMTADGAIFIMGDPL